MEQGIDVIIGAVISAIGYAVGYWAGQRSHGSVIDTNDSWIEDLYEDEFDTQDTLDKAQFIMPDRTAEILSKKPNATIDDVITKP